MTKPGAPTAATINAVMTPRVRTLTNASYSCLRATTGSSGVLLRSLVKCDEDRLISIRRSAPGIGIENYTFSMPDSV